MELDGDDRAKLDMLESYMASVGGEAAAGGEAGEASPARRMLRRPLARSRPRGHPLVGPEACLFAGAALWARGESPQRLHAEERLRWRSSAGPELVSHLTAFVTAQAPMPTKVEDVDKFMQDLAAAAQGRRPPDEAEAVEGEPSARI